MEEIANFIMDALKKDLPVIFFNWLSNSVDVMKHHGVTITEINKKEDDYILTLSSWGEVYKVSLKKFLNQPRTYTGFIYFEKDEILK